MILRLELHAALLAFVTLCALTDLSHAGEFYVSPTGSDTNAGTLASPFATLTRGQQAASAGDTVWIRGGQYTFSGTTADIGVLFNKSGTANNPIKYWAYPGETPAFDFFNLTTVARIRGFSVRADWLHFRGIELRGVQQIITDVNESWGIRVENGADYNVFEQLNLHHNEGPGLFIADGGNNLVLNSDSHHNYDPDRGGENADGFGSHSNDHGNRFVNCRAWENSDDGFDFINSPGQVTLEGSWSWRNGYIPGTNTSAGNGAGFKAGGFGLDSNTFPDPEDVPQNIVRGNLAFNNRVQGFYANHHPGGIDWLNNTAFQNSRGFDLLADVEPMMWPADHFLRNNISFSNSTNVTNLTAADVDDEFNTWNPGFAASAADFLSLSSADVDGPRQLDGSLPVLDFMRLSPGSSLIDAGTNVGLPFNGLAPDLGAFESKLAGDFDNDGDVDGRDFLLWQRNPSVGELADWQVNYAATNLLSTLRLPPSAFHAVPEPSPFWLASLGGIFWATCIRAHFFSQIAQR
jgi:hypothetical protein